MDRQWITIRGRRVLCKEFIHTLDSYRYSEAIVRRSSRVFDNFCRMICALQDATSEYINGKDSIEDGLAYAFNLYYMELPTERKLPEALEELLEQIESRLGIDLTEMLEQCVINTNKEYQRIQETQNNEVQRLLAIQSLMKENGIAEGHDQAVEDQIKKLLLLQKAKLNSDSYDLTENEIRVTNVWCEVLVASIFSEVISYGLMLSLVETELLDESEISDLLENKYDILKDYKWYSEDFLGSELDTPTVISADDVFSLCTERVEKIIGTTL